MGDTMGTADIDRLYAALTDPECVWCANETSVCDEYKNAPAVVCTNCETPLLRQF